MSTLDEITESKVTNEEEKNKSVDKSIDKSIDLGKPIKVVAITAACAGVGVMGAIGVVTCCCLGEILLPAALCLKVAGITGGAIGLVLGIGRKKQEVKK